MMLYDIIKLGPPIYLDGFSGDLNVEILEVEHSFSNLIYEEDKSDNTEMMQIQNVNKYNFNLDFGRVIIEIKCLINCLI